MKVCIAEKPAMAGDIAAILGATVRRDGYYEGGDWRVTWTYGHLCCLKDPHDYTDLWKPWTLSRLPMVPERFGIKLINNERYKRQFAVIKQLFAEADLVINCGDAGQEGELIQRWVMQKAGVKCPVMRLWVSSLTDESIRNGFKNLQPASKYDNLYLAGLSRAIGDWLLGLNATRLYSLRYGGGGRNVLSVGRVQTPTLALVVERQREIENFKPEDYWELHTTYRGADFTASTGRISDKDKAKAMLDEVKQLPLEITEVTRKAGREAPQRLFDLTSLQVECNHRWGWTAEDTLKLIQSLYEKKVTTYPRVDTTYLSDDIYPKVPEILRNMTPYAPLTAPVLAAKIPKSKKVFDNSKVTDHHAIIPTGQSPAALVGLERQLYHLIALRFIAAFYPDCRFEATTVEARAGKTPFKTTGKVITDPGWRALYAGDKNEKSEKEGEQDEDAVLPDFVKGESGPHEPRTVKKTTRPPKPYDEGLLLRAMETAGKTVDDDELRDAMKENGIGRPSTRSAIIETLFKRGYIERVRKSIKATPAGIDLIDTISDELLKSAKLTGLWENKLRRIERGEYSPAEFIDELKVMITRIVQEVMNDNSGHRIAVEQGRAEDGKGTRKKSTRAKAAGTAAKKSASPRKRAPKTIEEIPCPQCGSGHLLRGRTAYGCSRYAEGCAMRLPFDQYPADLTPAQLLKKLK
ncbi:MAG: DNA topoisomerase 3 [Muribaculaceae bacterium]|nr:DNA topoisomerase 3 [Muribaculaceae bacterium]